MPRLRALAVATVVAVTSSGCIALGSSMGLDMDSSIGSKPYMGESFNALSEPEQDGFRRCRPQTYRAMCGTDENQVFASLCVKERGEEYAGLEDARARKLWLLKQGCPLSMVDPAAALGER
ncbi:hypothetical protein A2cp1_2146 [Anaeromyxobacter dehalogenans 2CP-1]|uniref:Lipoprotein n=1 Tax=Anaeromyxobacter dehalogenans (strain ATCC BAA-258 / DSM 21875 / 2CP-1) TaxID=455488 RepID=B8J980_ANAD2|nr:hypothetical protein [Anaeromyxobacter dehalogenans]ACL65486.1 hypothetical protein A2cp1_2146 [Anaeromyxobacter dehalogenans 2CP-1]